MHRNWFVNRTNPEFLQYLSNKASISPVLAQVFVNRGIKDADSIKDFLSPSLGKLHDPFLMPDMKKGVDRLRAAIDRNETVFVHGDYDADGITSTALLVSTLRRLGLKTYYHIPNRMTEGYGVSDTGIRKAEACGARLIVTADCGISSETEISSALSMGMDVIVTDHHEPPEKLPEAAAVINPHRKDSGYPFKYLAGVGVAFKLIQALVRDMGRDDISPWELLDLVALGTVADSVPLLGENRILATYGLKAINNKPCRVGIDELKKVAGIKDHCRTGSLSYGLIPRINAQGRLDEAGEVVELFLTGDEAKAAGIAGFLDAQNRKRQKIEAGVLKNALDMIDPDVLENVIVLSSPEWHPGVIGIVASRLVDLFYRPVFLFSVKDSVAKGSARGIPPFHLYRAIAECREQLLAFGGHSQAAGLKLQAEYLPLFRKQINGIAEKHLSVNDMIPRLEIDAAIKFSDISADLVKELSFLEPYGYSNREPLFGAKDIKIVNHRIVGSNHLKMRLMQESVNGDTIGFSMGDRLEKIGAASSLDIAFVPSLNEWNGASNLQLNLKAVRPGS